MDHRLDSPTPDLPITLSVALTRAALVCRHVQSSLTASDTLIKSDRSPVTIADFASQAIVAHTLHVAHAACPSAERFHLVAEESATELRWPESRAILNAVTQALRESHAWPDATRLAVLDAIDLGAADPLQALLRREPFWTLDPIDGTKGFLRACRGEPGQYAIALALVDRTGPILAGMACPNLSPDLTDNPTSNSQVGSFLLSTDPRQRPQSVATHESLSQAQRCPRLAESVDAGHSDQALSASILSALASHLGQPALPPIRIDSQAKYALLARGQADAYLRLPTRADYIERIWDHAAGSLIARNAGCIVTDLRGKPLDFTRGRGLEANVGVLAAHPSWHATILETIAKLGIA